MNWLSLPIVKHFTKFFLFIIFSCIQVTVHAWELDLTRRQPEMKQLVKTKTPNELKPKESSSLNFTEIAGQLEPEKTIIIINTETGFIPNRISMQKGKSYKIHVVNLNTKEKNISFVLDSFSENHSTYYGELKNFILRPQREGIYSFISPENNFKGEFIVTGESQGPELRSAASSPSEK